MADATKAMRLALTRAEYDKFIGQHADWVRENWHLLARKWSLNGVSLTFTTEDQLAFVAAFLARHR